MAGDAHSAEEYERRIAELEAVAARQAELIKSQQRMIDAQRQAERRQRRSQAKGGPQGTRRRARPPPTADAD